MTLSGRGRVLVAALLVLAVLGGLLRWVRRDATQKPERPRTTRAGPHAENVRPSHPKPGSLVLPPLIVQGVAPGAWYFEADFPVELTRDSGTSLVQTHATARGPWMTRDPVGFRAVLRWDPATDGPARLILHRANASDRPEFDATVRIPLRLAGPTVPRVYFPNSILDPRAEDCRRVHPVPRPFRDGGGETVRDRVRHRLEHLLRGPNPAERETGYYTSLPEEVRVLEIHPEGERLRVDFDRSLSEGVAGSCRVLSIRAQIESTLLGVPGVQSVDIRAGGQLDGALQP